MNLKTSTRTQKAKVNILISLSYQLTSAIIGLILPRYVLKTFGSDVNGIIQTINQLLNYVVLLEGGIGGLVLAAFYKPLSSNDTEAISDIFNNTKNFFRKISFVFLSLVLFLCVFAKYIVRTSYSVTYVVTLVLILGFNYYFSYYFGITHQLLLKADQKLYIVQFVQILTLVANAIICIVFMNLGANIHVVKLISALVFIFNPIVYRCYVKKNYQLSNKIYDSQREMPRKRDGVAHHISYFIHRNTDVVLLSIFAGVKEVSVYSVYASVVMGLENILVAISSALSGTIGNIIAKNEKETLLNSFEIYTVFNTFITTFFCTVASIMIIPFIRIYTSGVNDINYIRPEFAYVFIASQWFYCIRIPYGNVVSAAGHYNQTKPGAYMEVAINVVLSLILVRKYSIGGVAIGTLLAMASRTLYTAWYLSRNILNRSIYLFFKNEIGSLILSVVIMVLANNVYNSSPTHFISWTIDACFVSVCVLIILIAFNFCFNNKLFMYMINRVFKSCKNK